MASKFVEYKPNKLSHMGCNAGGLLQALNEAENMRRTQGSVLGYLPQGPIDKAAKDFFNKATGGWCCSLELAVDISNFHSDNGILASDHYFTVLFQRCY